MRTRDEGVGTGSAGTGDAPGRVAGWIALLVAAGSFVGAYALAVAGGRTALSGAVVLATAALAASAVAAASFLGGSAAAERDASRAAAAEPGAAPAVPGDGGAGGEAPETGPVVRFGRPLTLSERLAAGALGGALGGLAVTAGVWIVAGLGLTDLLGVTIGASVSWYEIGTRAWSGTLWGIGLGLFFPWMPWESAVTRGILFGLVPALYALLVEYPMVRGLGWFGVDLGALAWIFVLGFHVLWGGVAGALFQWAQVTSDGPLDEPLVA